MLLRCSRSGRSPHVDGWAYVTLHHTSEGLVTSRCYFWIQCWCNGGLADSATATSFFWPARRLEWAVACSCDISLLHRDAPRDGRGHGCSSLVRWSCCCWQIVTWCRAEFSGDGVARCMHRYEVRCDPHMPMPSEHAESATHTHTRHASRGQGSWVSGLWFYKSV